MEVEINAADSRCQGELTEGKSASVRAELENGAVRVWKVCIRVEMGISLFRLRSEEVGRDDMQVHLTHVGHNRAYHQMHDLTKCTLLHHFHK